MGKTPIALRIGIHPVSISDPVVVELIAKGHEVVVLPAVDVILDPMSCSRKTYVEAALRGARARKKREKGNEEGK